MIAKNIRSMIRQNETERRNNENAMKGKLVDETDFQKSRTAGFLLNEVSRLMIELKNEFSKI